MFQQTLYQIITYESSCPSYNRSFHFHHSILLGFSFDYDILIYTFILHSRNTKPIFRNQKSKIIFYSHFCHFILWFSLVMYFRNEGFIIRFFQWFILTCCGIATGFITIAALHTDDSLIRLFFASRSSGKLCLFGVKYLKLPKKPLG